MQQSDHFQKTYADLVYDLCASLLKNPSFSKIVFRNIFQNLRAQPKSQHYQTYERAWVLRVTSQALLNHYARFGKNLSQEDRIQLESRDHAGPRVEQFPKFFSRLEPQDQLLLLLHDKYDIHGEELAAALGAPEDSLKIRRQQALKTLEEWIWKQN